MIYKATSSNGSNVISELTTQEVLRICQADLSRCKQVISLLNYRMTKYDPLIKLKCVKLCRRLLEKQPNGEIRKLLKRNCVENIRTLSRFAASGTDPQLQDMARQIRFEAEETLKYIFSEDHDDNNENMRGQYEVDGSDQHSSSDFEPPNRDNMRMAGNEQWIYGQNGNCSERYGVGSRRMVGIGSADLCDSGSIRTGGGGGNYSVRRSIDDYNPGSGIRSIVDLISTNIVAANIPKKITDSLANIGLGGTGNQPGNQPGFNGFSGRSRYDNGFRETDSAVSPGRNNSRNTTTYCRNPNAKSFSGISSYQMRAGGVDVSQPGGTAFRGQIRNGSRAINRPRQPQFDSNENTGVYERRIIDEISEPSGAKLTPSAADLHQFCLKCASLDVSAVVLLIFNRLKKEEDSEETSNPKVKLRLLCVVEGLLKCDRTLNSDEKLSDVVVDVIEQNQQLVLEIINQLEQVPLCEKTAREVLRLLPRKITYGRAIDRRGELSSRPATNTSLLDEDDSVDRSIIMDETTHVDRSTSCGSAVARVAVSSAVDELIDTADSAAGSRLKIEQKTDKKSTGLNSYGNDLLDDLLSDTQPAEAPMAMPMAVPKATRMKSEGVKIITGSTHPAKSESNLIDF